MLRTLIRTSLTATLLATTMIACTQSPAQVDLKGQNSFGRNSGGGGLFSNISSTSEPKGYVTGSTVTASKYQPAPVYTNSETAGVHSVGVSDLPPLTSAKAAPAKPAWSSADNTPAAKSVVAPVIKSAPVVAVAEPVKPAAPAVIKAAPLAEVAPAAGDAKKQATSVNKWTGKARPVELYSEEDSFNLQPQSKQAVTAKEPLVSQIKTPQEKAEAKPIAQLDNVIESDKGAKPEVAGFQWPVSGKKVLSSFGPKGKGKINDGINIASAEGEPVWAAADGEVVYVGNELQGYGNMVLIKHAGGKTTTYAHLSKASVDKYARVKQGDVIGAVGKTGNVNSPQLHFAIREGKEPVDPMKYVGRDVASLH